MNYELAKQLKDAGFPQDSDYVYTIKKGEEIMCHNYYSNSWQTGTAEELCVRPTLSELIEACGEDFPLRLQSSYEGNDVYWQADNWGHFAPNVRDIISETGKTPEEAVANLWLEMNTVSGKLSTMKFGEDISGAEIYIIK